MFLQQSAFHNVVSHRAVYLCRLRDQGKYVCSLPLCLPILPTFRRFLSACGTQREPSVEQLAQKLLENPLMFYKLTGGPQRYGIP